MRVLITGGAGFVGSYLARSLRQSDPSGSVVAFDNLKRRGSELNLSEFKKLGIEFVHGDIRNPSDLEDLSGQFDLLIEASAEPSVLAGLNGAPAYLLDTNLVGTLNCLEFARKRVNSLIFLSTSRVYSIRSLKEIKLVEAASRFEISTEPQAVAGVSASGISEEFETRLPRSLYGATKLASEMIIQEYVETYNMKAIINRCGVIAGPGQFGKVDQGVFTLWVANHFFKKPLSYTGFGGAGKQVRDLLHPSDLASLLQMQLQRIEEFSGETFNVGGGRKVSTSMAELTDLCTEFTGNSIKIAQNASTSPVDIPLYLSDTRKVSEAFEWMPQKSVKDIVMEVAHWIRANESNLAPLFS